MKFVIFSILCFAVIVQAGDYYETKILNLNAVQINAMDIEAETGFLYINGTNNSDKIIVTAEIEITDIDEDRAPDIIERHIELTLQREGNHAVLKSRLPSSSLFSRAFHSVHVNLTVELPQNLQLYIDDGSGAIRISKMNAPVEVDDGSGSIEMHDVAGNLKIEDGSGEIELKNIIGNIRIEDDSGSIEVKDVDGDVSIDDGSGSITVTDVKGSVTIKDGSGSIEITRVENDVTIEEDGSGGVYISSVRGTVHRYDSD